MVALVKPMPAQEASGLSSRSGGMRPSERRTFPRQEVHHRIAARRHAHSIDAHCHPLVSMNLRDVSLGGCSALLDRPIDAGERLTLYFQAQGPHRAWDAHGRVLRCQVSPLGYRVAVQFDALPAA